MPNQTCDYPGCSRVFKYPSRLRRHQTIHAMNRPLYSCTHDGCDRSYFSPHDLKVHMRNHANIKLFRCSVVDCQAAFPTNTRLRLHSMIHKDTRPYNCKVNDCKKSYKTPAGLRIHRFAHMTVLPHLCRVAECGKSFKHPNLLVLHMRTHNGERPFVCEVVGCDVSCASSSNLTQHYQRNHTQSGCAKRKIQEEGAERFFTAKGLRKGDDFIREKHVQCLDQDSYVRIDFVIYLNRGTTNERHVYLEIDERQHSGYPVECDSKRYLRIRAATLVEQGEFTIPILALRFNPDGYSIDGVLQRIRKQDRYNCLWENIQDWKNLDQVPLLSLGYLYYDLDSAGLLKVLQDEDFFPAAKELVVKLRTK